MRRCNLAYGTRPSSSTSRARRPPPSPSTLTRPGPVRRSPSKTAITRYSAVPFSRWRAADVLKSSLIPGTRNRRGATGMVWAALVFALAVFFSMIPGAAAQTTNVFGRTDSGAPDAANVAGLPQPASLPSGTSADSARHFVMPELLRRAVSASIRIQSRLDARLQDILASQRDGTSRLTAWTLIALSFGYGVLHALGPGHGKLAVSAYLVSHRARVTHAVALSAWSACVQTLSAIALVGGAAWLTRAGLSGVLTQASSLDLVSYFALLGVGLWTIWSIVTRRDCCDEVRVSLVPRKRFGMFAAPRHRPDNGPNAGYLGTNLAKHRGRSRWAQADSRDGPTWIARQNLPDGTGRGYPAVRGRDFRADRGVGQRHLHDWRALGVRDGRGRRADGALYRLDEPGGQPAGVEGKWIAASRLGADSRPARHGRRAFHYLVRRVGRFLPFSWDGRRLRLPEKFRRLQSTCLRSTLQFDNKALYDNDSQLLIDTDFPGVESRRSCRIFNARLDGRRRTRVLSRRAVAAMAAHAVESAIRAIGRIDLSRAGAGHRGNGQPSRELAFHHVHRRDGGVSSRVRSSAYCCCGCVRLATSVISE